MDKILLFVLLCLSCANPKPAAKDQDAAKPAEVLNSLSGANILMVIAPKDFRDEELFIPKDIFSKAGANVAVASTTLDTCVGMLGGKIRPDVEISNASIDDFNAVVFVGGAGATTLWDNVAAHNLATSAKESQKLIGAICLAPVILTKAGIMNGVQATCFKSAKAELIAGGAIFKSDPVVVHQAIVTADGPLAAEAFAQKITNILAAQLKVKAEPPPADSNAPITDSTTQESTTEERPPDTASPTTEDTVPPTETEGQ